jgi:superfamily II DNA or RNA helicase
MSPVQNLTHVSGSDPDRTIFSDSISTPFPTGIGSRATGGKLEWNMRRFGGAILKRITADHPILYPPQIPGPRAVGQALLDGHPSVSMVYPGGGGKTVMASQIDRALREEGHDARVLYITSQIPLVEEALRKIGKFAPKTELGMAYSGGKDRRALTVTTYDSLSTFLPAALEYDALIFDEGQHFMTPSISGSENLPGIANAFANAIWIAQTATPIRTSRLHLGLYFHPAYTMADDEAIRAELILPYNSDLVPFDLSLDGVQIDAVDGDYDEAAIAKKVNIPPRNIAMVRYYMESINPVTGKPFLGGDQSLFSTIDQQHARDIATLINQNLSANDVGGMVPAEALYADPRHIAHMRRVLEAFNAGEIANLVIVRKLGEGYDNEYVRNVFILAPSLSYPFALQRGSRPRRPIRGLDANGQLDFRGRGLKPVGIIREIFDYATRGLQPWTYHEAVKYPPIPWGQSRPESDPHHFRRVGERQTQNRRTQVSVTWDAAAIERMVSDSSALRRDIEVEQFSWLTADAVASQNNLLASEVYTIINRLKPVHDQPDIMVDPHNPHLKWQIRLPEEGTQVRRRLSYNEVHEFIVAYHLNAPGLTPDRISLTDIALQKQMGNFGRHLVEGFHPGTTDGVRIDPETNRLWHIDLRRNRGRIVHSIAAAEAAEFFETYNFDQGCSVLLT